MWEFLKNVYRRAVIIIRSNWNSWDKPNSDQEFEEIDLPRGDRVVAVVAERNFVGAYPWQDIDFKTEIISIPYFNKTSVLNMIVSFLSAIMFISSFLLFLNFLYLLILGSYSSIVFLFFGYNALDFGVRLADLFLRGGATAMALSSGLFLRKLDKAVTARHCLKAAQKALQNPELYHQEKCFLLLEDINERVWSELGEYQERIAKRSQEVSRLVEMCKEIKSIPDLDGKSKNKDLAPYRISIRKLRGEIIFLRKQMAAAEKSVAGIRAEVLKSSVMSRLANMTGTLDDLKTGLQKKQIRDLSNKTEDCLALIEGQAKNLHESFLIETGIAEATSEDSKNLDNGKSKKSDPLLE